MNRSERKRPGWSLQDEGAAHLEQERARRWRNVDRSLHRRPSPTTPISRTRAAASRTSIGRARPRPSKATRRRSRSTTKRSSPTSTRVPLRECSCEADATLSIETSLPGVVVVAQRYAESDRVLTPRRAAPLPRPHADPGSAASARELPRHAEAHREPRRSLSGGCCVVVSTIKAA